MGKALVDVRHPDVGIGRVPQRTLHLYERAGWKPITPEQAKEFAGELAELDRAFTAAGVTGAKDRRALSTLSKEQRAELDQLVAAEQAESDTAEPAAEDPKAPAEVPEAPAAAPASTPTASTRPTTGRSGGTTKEG